MHFSAKFSLVLRCIRSIREGGAAPFRPPPLNPPLMRLDVRCIARHSEGLPRLKIDRVKLVLQH